MPLNLREANIERQKEWDKDNNISLSYRGNEMAGECGEACNVIKKLEREAMGLKGNRATVQQLADELADVVICADLIAMDMGIDLMGQAVPEKFNITSDKYDLKTRMSNPYPMTYGEIRLEIKARLEEAAYLASRIVASPEAATAFLHMLNISYESWQSRIGWNNTDDPRLRLKNSKPNWLTKLFDWFLGKDTI